MLILIYDFYDVLVPVVALYCKSSYCKKKKKKPQRQQQQQQQQQQKNETCAWYEYITDWSKSYLSSFDVLGKMS